jgi:hypothetical protein
LATTKLSLLNGACIAMGHRRLADTGEGVEAGRELNYVYDQVLAECLASGSWNFAMETVKMDADTGVTPAFGYPRVFAKPTDWVRTMGVSEDPDFTVPLTRYYDDANYLSADNTPIYLRYVSNDTGLGLELSRWPAHFTRFVELELACRVCTRLTQSIPMKREDLEKDRDKAKKQALTIDAMNEPNPKWLPPSSWTTARGGRRGPCRGARGSLIG